MCFGKGLGEDSVANLSEKVSLTRRVREGAWDSRGSPPPPPPLLFSCSLDLAAAGWEVRGVILPPGLIRTQELQDRSWVT